MTSNASNPTALQPTHAPGEDVLGADTAHGHGHSHNPYLAHHFTSMQQQFASAKLGMWVFLATEILMFGGLFCAYAFYRANHPDMYMFAHYYLDTNLGFINTIILLASSFTMAWGVRAAMLGQQQLLKILLILTLIGGLGFMVIKTFEYASKYNHNLWFGPDNAFYTADGQVGNEANLSHALEYHEKKVKAKGAHGAAAYDDAKAKDGHGPSEKSDGHGDRAAAAAAGAGESEAEATTPPAGDAQADDADQSAPAATGPEHFAGRPTAQGPGGMNVAFAAQPEASTAELHRPAPVAFDDLKPLDQERAHVFFQIYFLMTGLHGLHVLIGMGLIGWLAFRAFGGAFGPQNFTAVDIVGLYWHLVDLIWIFLFPLLYLIH